jgi:hypothetical protein
MYELRCLGALQICDILAINSYRWNAHVVDFWLRFITHDTFSPNNCGIHTASTISVNTPMKSDVLDERRDLSERCALINNSSIKAQVLQSAGILTGKG